VGRAPPAPCQPGVELIDAEARASELIDRLSLKVLPGESGWWTAVARSAVRVMVADGPALSASNTIDCLLSPDRPVNVWHRLAGDDAPGARGRRPG
jgi:hypothetical protein